jgi:hypothetical protein
LALRYKDDLIARSVYPPYKDDYFGRVKIFIWLSVAAVICMILVWIVSLFFRGGEALINATELTAVGSDTSWYNNTGIWLRNTLLGSTVITSIWGGIQYIAYRNQLKKYNNECTLLDETYTSIANDFYRDN